MGHNNSGFCNVSLQIGQPWQFHNIITGVMFHYKLGNRGNFITSLHPFTVYIGGYGGEFMVRKEK